MPPKFSGQPAPPPIPNVNANDAYGNNVFRGEQKFRSKKMGCAHMIWTFILLFSIYCSIDVFVKAFKVGINMTVISFIIAFPFLLLFLWLEIKQFLVNKNNPVSLVIGKDYIEGRLMHADDLSKTTFDATRTRIELAWIGEFTATCLRTPDDKAAYDCYAAKVITPDQLPADIPTIADDDGIYIAIDASCINVKKRVVLAALNSAVARAHQAEAFAKSESVADVQPLAGEGN